MLQTVKQKNEKENNNGDSRVLDVYVHYKYSKWGEL